MRSIKRTVIPLLASAGLAMQACAGGGEGSDRVLRADSPLWGPQPDMHPVTEQKSPDQLPFRSWQLQGFDKNNIEKERKRIKDIINSAADYGINNIQLSHQQVMYVYQLLEDPERIKLFNEYIQLAHAKGMTVHIWTHEFGGIPDKIKSQANWFDKPEVWELLQQRHEALFKVMPELDGLVLTFHETEIKVFDVESKMPLAERIAKLINQLNVPCRKYKKDLIVRTFAYEPKEVEGISKAFSMIDPEIILMSKCVPHDWEVFYPHNLVIGQYPDRKTIIEFDPGAEYYGRGYVPYLYPEYLDFRLKYARDRNAHGYVARVERLQHPCAVGGRNELNLYAFKRLAEDPNVTTDQIWKEYISMQVGEGPHVEPLVEALKLTDDVLNRCYFMLGTWYNNHSLLPSSGYASGHARYILKWHPQYKDVVARLRNPDSRTVGEVYLESKESVTLAKLALSKLEDSKKAGLADDDYKEYRNQLMDLLAEAEKWATHRNEFIRKKSDGAQPSYDGPFPIGGPARLKK